LGLALFSAAGATAAAVTRRSSPLSGEQRLTLDFIDSTFSPVRQILARRDPESTNMAGS
jgi:hypothetical protein